MFQFSRTAQEALREQKLQDLTLEILKTNSSFDIAEKLSQMLLDSTSSTPIVVSKEEMERIINLFRVRGYSQTGERIARGRKRLANEDYEDDTESTLNLNFNLPPK